MPDADVMDSLKQRAMIARNGPRSPVRWARSLHLHSSVMRSPGEACQQYINCQLSDYRHQVSIAFEDGAGCNCSKRKIFVRLKKPQSSDAHRPGRRLGPPASHACR